MRPLHTLIDMSVLHVLIDIGLVTLAAVAGVVGTGLIFTALTDHLFVALLWGLPLALGGLYWCSRALARSQRYARRRRSQAQG